MMLPLNLYFLQRLSALIMAPLVLGHIAVMIYAVRNGLTAEEILGRTQGSWSWFLFYGTFVIAVSIHAAIGIRVIAFEVFKAREIILSVVSWVSFLGLFYLGARAVYAVTVSS